VEHVTITAHNCHTQLQCLLQS